MGILKIPRATTAELAAITPAQGELIYDTTTDQLKKGDGATVGGVPVGEGSGSITVSATAPADPAAGDQWWDSETGETFVYYEDADTGQWVQADNQVAAAVKVGRETGWKDMLAPLTAAGVPNQNAPTLTNLVIGGITRREYAFAVNDYLYVQPFHINHDVLPGGKAYLHIHWTSNGTNTQPVSWRFDIARALGHQQAAFSQVTSVTVTQAATGTALTHMVAEVADIDALTLTEPDELILVTVTRITNGGTENTDTIFGLMVDIHYQSDRDNTPNKAPNFYA